MVPYEVTAEKLMFSVSSNHKVKRGNERKKEKKKEVRTTARLCGQQRFEEARKENMEERKCDGSERVGCGECCWLQMGALLCMIFTHIKCPHQESNLGCRGHNATS